MFKGVNLKPYIMHALIAALLYCLPVIFFLNFADYTRAYLLYVGNFLFLLVIAWFLFTFNLRRDENAGSLAMLTASVIATTIGAAIATILSVILLFVFVPGLFGSGTPDKVLTNAPGNTVLDKTEGLTFMLISNAIIGNMAGGLFVSIIFPFALKGDQTREKVPRKKQAEL